MDPTIDVFLTNFRNFHCWGTAFLNDRLRQLSKTGHADGGAINGEECEFL